MSTADPLRGTPRIHGELLQVGIEISESAVQRYMVQSPKPPSITEFSQFPYSSFSPSGFLEH